MCHNENTFYVYIIGEYFEDQVVENISLSEKGIGLYASEPTANATW